MKKSTLFTAAIAAAIHGAVFADPPLFQRIPAPRPAPVAAPAQLKLAQQLAQVEKQIADLQNFLTRADLTEAASKQYDAKLNDLRAQRDKLRAQLRPAAPVQKVHRAPNGKAFPAHWGAPPRLQTKDLRPLPGGYGRGSGTLARWIAGQLALDKKNPNRAKIKPPIAAPAPPPDPVAPAPNAPKGNLAHIAKVKTALAAWAKAKTKCGGNYEYTIGFQSAFGFGHTTTIVVKNNKVFERRFEEFNRREPPRPGAKPKGYVEKGDAIGKNKKGAPAKTLDEVYAEAGKVAAQALRPSERRYVRTNKNGLLTSCFIIDTRIADDAPRKGVVLGKISLAGGNAKKVYKAPNGKPFPVHWGAPPLRQTRDLRPFPGGYGRGSSTLRNWIQKNLEKDAKKNNGAIQIQPVPPPRPPGLPAPPPRPPKLQVAPTQLLGPPLRQPVPGVKPVPPIRILPVQPAPRAAPGKNAARITELEQEIAKMKDFARRARFTQEGFKKFQAKLAKLEQELAALKAGGKVAGVLPSKLTLKDAQGGFAGFTGWMTTINVDGTWNRRQFFNQQLRPIEKQGKLTKAQANAIKAALATAQVEKLPARLGNFRGANPHVVTLTYGDRQSVLTLPTGAKLAKPLPGGKLDGTLAFALVAHELMSLKQGAAAGGTKPPPKIYRAANGKAFPAHWGAPPRIQTRDFRPLPGGYGNGSGTLGRWIQQNLDKDKAGANTTKPVAPPNAANGKEIAQLQARVKQIKNFMARARLTKEASDRFLAEIGRLENRIAELNGKPQEVRPPVRPPAKPKPNARKKFPAHWGAPPRIQTADHRKLPDGYGFGSSTMTGWIQRNLDADAKDPNRGKPEAGQRPAVSAKFARQHPAGSYAPGELLVGVQKGAALADSTKALQTAIPGLKVVKAMINNTIFHVRLPATTNVEQGMTALKKVKAVRYAELNGIARIQPVPRPGIRPGPRIPTQRGRPLIRPRR